MNKNEIQKLLKENHVRFIQRIASLRDSEFLHSNNGKWTAGQQLEHIVKSIRPVTLAFAFPPFLLRMIFGKANRSSRTFAALVERYQQKLAGGGKAPSVFIPMPVPVSGKDKLAKQLQSLVDSLIDRAGAFSETQLDSLILPHPLLGKLTLREMLYFTAYHVEHHGKQVIQNIAAHQHA